MSPLHCLPFFEETIHCWRQFANFFWYLLYFCKYAKNDVQNFVLTYCPLSTFMLLARITSMYLNLKFVFFSNWIFLSHLLECAVIPAFSHSASTYICILRVFAFFGYLHSSGICILRVFAFFGYLHSSGICILRVFAFFGYLHSSGICILRVFAFFGYLHSSGICILRVFAFIFVAPLYGILTRTRKLVYTKITIIWEIRFILRC